MDLSLSWLELFKKSITSFCAQTTSTRAMFFGTMLFVPLLAVLGYVRAAERRRDGRSTLGIWLTTRFCRMLFAVLLHAAVMPIMCVTLALSMMHIVECFLCYMCRRMGGVGDQSSHSRAERRALEKTRRKLRKRLRPYRWLLGRLFLW